MLWLWVALGIVGGLALLILIPSLIMIGKLPSMSKPLTDAEVEVCSKIVQRRKGYPYICRWAVKHKACPCLPCTKLEEGRKSTTS